MEAECRRCEHYTNKERCLHGYNNDRNGYSWAPRCIKFKALGRVCMDCVQCVPNSERCAYMYWQDQSCRMYEHEESKYRNAFHWAMRCLDYKKGESMCESRGETKPEVLEITKSKVLEAAKTCSTAKSVLKSMFPEVFEEPKPEVDPSRLMSYSNDQCDFLVQEVDGVEVRGWLGDSTVYVNAHPVDSKLGDYKYDEGWPTLRIHPNYAKQLRDLLNRIL